MEVTESIREAATQLLDIYKTELENHKATGKLISTAKVVVGFDGRYFEISFMLQDYWKYLENGTKPHWPPVDAIENWVRAKKLVPRAVNGKVPSTKQLAFLISRGISKKGTEATKALSDSIDQSDAVLERMVEVITAQLQEEIDKEVQEEA